MVTNEDDKTNNEKTKDKKVEKIKDETIINKFILKYSRPTNIKKKQRIEQKRYNKLNPDMYYTPEIPDEIEEKINRIKKITQSIENKIIKGNIKKLQNKYKIDYFNELNKNQYFATTTITGPVLVIAGAGSGKTRTLSYRVSYLIENGIDPRKILLLTFTRKAAKEMISRTISLLNNDKAKKVMGGTFHSFANHIIRRYSNLLNIPSNFTVIDTTDSQDIISLIRSEKRFNKKERMFPRKSRIYKIISKSRNCRIPIKEVIEKEYSGLEEYEKDISLICKIYHAFKKQKNLFDFDDLIDFFIESLKKNSKFRDKIQEKFHYVMVDEYQDTNIPQKELIDLIVGKIRNVMVVGDDSQSIYAFRGANFENILTFPETYSDCKVVKLEENYRSNQGILNFTNSIVENARIGYIKKLTSKNKKDYKPEVQSFYSDEAEAEFVVNKIIELREKNIDLSEIAVLYRATFHSNYIQTELMKRNIPYVVFGGIKFIERQHVRDIIAFLRIILNPYDAISWNRVLRMIDGIGPITANIIIDIIDKNNGKIIFNEFKNKKYYNYLQELHQLFNKISKENNSISEMINIIKNYYEPILKSKEFDYKLRLLDIDVLINLSSRYNELDEFLTDFALDPPSNQFQNRIEPLINETEEKPLTLSTVHSAKGLEWNTVFIIHLLDGLFPSSQSLNDIEAIEEERRIFYVASTRAKEYLFLTLPSYLYLWSSAFIIPSRFIVEVDEKTLNNENINDLFDIANILNKK